MFGRKQEDANGGGVLPDRNPFFGLRGVALDATPDLAGFNPVPPGRTVYGALLDWGLDQGHATLFTLENGSASLYLSSGGGVIGGQFQPAAHDAARAFILGFEPFMVSMSADVGGDLPPAGYTDLRALTTAGRLVSRAPTDQFGQGQHPMSSVFNLGQAVIAALRQAAETPP